MNNSLKLGRMSNLWDYIYFKNEIDHKIGNYVLIIIIMVVNLEKKL